MAIVTLEYYLLKCNTRVLNYVHVHVNPIGSTKVYCTMDMIVTVHPIKSACWYVPFVLSTLDHTLVVGCNTQPIPDDFIKSVMPEGLIVVRIDLVPWLQFAEIQSYQLLVLFGKILG